MKLTASRTALLKLLGNVTRVVEKRNTIPILSNVKITAESGKLTIYATDLDIEATGSCDATVSAAGDITAPAGTLHDIVRKLPEGDITFEVNDPFLVVRAGRSRFQLQTLPAEDYPDLASGSLPTSFEMSGVALLRLIGPAQFAISTEETRYYLNGIYLHTVGSERPRLRAVATDGHRLARIEMEAPEGAAGMPGVIVPRKMIGEIVRLLKEHSDDNHGPAAVRLSPQKIQLAIAGIVLTSKLIDGSFPDYERVIPQANDKILTVDTAILAAAVDRVATVASESKRAVKVALSDGRLTLTMEDSNTGAATEEIEAEYDSAPLEIGFNARYLAEMLTQTGGDTTRVAFSEAGSPTLFQSREGSPALFVLMPMRV